MVRLDLMATPPAAAPSSVDPKTQLNHFCQKFCQRPVTKSDISYTTNKFGNRYQAIVRLDCVQGQEYAGHLVLNQKDAEKSAAEQAIIAFSQSNLLQEAQPVDKDKKKKKQTKLTPEEHALRKAKQEEEGNPAVTPKTLLNALVMKIVKRYLQKGETVYETKTYAGGGHQATVKITALPDEWGSRMWAGHVCNTKQKAEQSAAEMALESIKQDAELMQESEKPKGMGKGEKGKGKGKGNFWGPWSFGWWNAKGSDLPRKPVLTEPITGEVLEWKDSFGWIKPDVTIDHKDAGRREGKIFVGKSDVPETLTMAAGIKISFTVYEDMMGLGAQDLQAS